MGIAPLCEEEEEGLLPLLEDEPVVGDVVGEVLLPELLEEEDVIAVLDPVEVLLEDPVLLEALEIVLPTQVELPEFWTVTGEEYCRLPCESRI